MRCQKCETNIPPEWVAAIKSGVCPACGENIYNDETKVLIEELAAAMTSMPANPQGLAGWLISNYHIRKIGEAKPVDKFYGDKKEVMSPAQQHRLKVADNPVQKFLSRTDAYKSVQKNESKIAQMARSIQDLDVEEQNIEMMENEPEQFDEDGEPIAERGVRRSRALVTGNDLIDSNAAPLTASELASLAGSVVENNNSQEILKLQRLKRVKAQQAVLGGGEGSFRRGG